MFINTVESRLLNLQGKRKLVREIGGKNVVFEYKKRRTTFFSSHREFRKSDGSRNRDSTVFKV